MRSLGFFLGSNHKRNDPYKVEELHVRERYDDAVHTGNMGADGFAVLAKADPDRLGSRPLVGGQPINEGPDFSWEQ